MVTKMGSGHQSSSGVSQEPVVMTMQSLPTSRTTTAPVTTVTSTPPPQCSQVIQQRKRPPLPNFLPVSTHDVGNQGNKDTGDHGNKRLSTTPSTLQSLLCAVSQPSPSGQPRRFVNNNAGLPFFPTSPALRHSLIGHHGDGGQRVPSLRSPIEILNYAASLKKAQLSNMDGNHSDQIHALEDALGFLKAFSENACAVKTSSPTETESEGPTSGGQTHGQTTLQVPSTAPPQHGLGHPPRVGDSRPKSFLREEMDEFDRIFTELLSPRGKTPSLGFLEVDSDSDVTPDATLVGGVTGIADNCCCDTDSDGDAMKCRTSDNGAKPCDRSCDRCGQIRTRELRGESLSSSKLVPNKCLSCPADPSLTGGATGGSSVNQGIPVVNPGAATVLDDNDKLFTQLLDDLDNITGDTPSVRRRKKARDLFSNWLFSEDPKSPDNTSVRRCREAYQELSRRRSADLPQGDHRRHEAFAKWRPRSFEYLSEDDADSGYHTGCSTLQSRGPKAAKKPGDWTLTREDLRRSIETFNANNHGLIMSLQSDTNTFQGFIRVHMNLIRPINMSLSTRPTSIYDVVGQGEDEEEFIGGPEDTQITSFYLPKDTTKVIHINSDTTTQEVIKALLSKFKITDNPRKFALYEKVLESDKKASMHRMEEEECPLPLCLCWTTDGIDGLDRRKFVLQENDTGEIMWEAFSLPELENFLRILNREEEEYVEQVKDKYRMLRIHMHRRLQEIQETKALPADPKRKPVFV